MLDPREQAKGGFGAFVERENERGAAAEAAAEAARVAQDAQHATTEPIATGPALVRDESPRRHEEMLVDEKGQRPMPIDRGFDR